MSLTSPIIRWLEVWTMCCTCFRRSLEELCWNKFEISWITLNCRSKSLPQQLIAPLICTIWLWNLDMMAQRLWPLRCCPKVMNMCSHANAMPDLWRTSLVKHGISLVEHATLAWNLQPRLQRPATDTQDHHHLWTWKCNKNRATEPSWVKLRSSTGPWETRVPAAPLQLLLLSFPVKAASWTATRKVEELQSSSRTALSAVHVLTEMISWPRQSSPSIHHGTAQKHNSKGCSYMWFFKSFHTLKGSEVAGLSCASLCITVLVVGVFSAAAGGPAELFRISISPPRCVRFFATSALEGTSSTRDQFACRWFWKHPLQTDRRMASWAQKNCQDAAPCPVVAILSRFMLWGAWGHLPCLCCLPGPLFQYEIQSLSWTAIFGIFGGVDNWIWLKKQPLQPNRIAGKFLICKTSGRWIKLC